MDKKNWRSTVLLLRLLTFVLLVGALAILATNKTKVFDFADNNNDGVKQFTFKDASPYRYLLAVEAIGCVYVLVQIPLTVVNVSRGAFGGDLRIYFNQFADTIFALLFATGAGAAVGLTVDESADSGFSKKFVNLIYVSASLLLTATISMAATMLTLAYYNAVK